MSTDEPAPPAERIPLPRGGTFCRACGRVSLYLVDDGTRFACPGCEGIPLPVPTVWLLTADPS